MPYTAANGAKLQGRDTASLFAEMTTQAAAVAAADRDRDQHAYTRAHNRYAALKIEIARRGLDPHLPYARQRPV